MLDVIAEDTARRATEEKELADLLVLIFLIWFFWPQIKWAFRMAGRLCVWSWRLSVKCFNAVTFRDLDRQNIIRASKNESMAMQKSIVFKLR